MEKRLERRVFFLSLAVALFVFALLLFLMLSAIHPSAAQPLAAQPQQQEPQYQPQREDVLSVLFVGVSEDGSRADTFLLARFDPARGTVPLVVLPGATALQHGGDTLADAFRYGGAAYAREMLSRTLGVTIDRYVRIDETGFLIAAATVGSVQYDLGREIPLEQPGAAGLTLSAGIQLLDGPKAASVMAHDYGGDELERCRAISDLAGAVVNQRRDVVLSAVADKLFTKLVNAVETDISYADYADRKQAAAHLAQLPDEIAAPIAVQGEFIGEKFHLSDTLIALLTQTMA